MAAAADTGDEDLSASAAGAGPGAVRGGLRGPEETRLPAPSPVLGAEHRAGLTPPLTEPAERVPQAGQPW